MKWCTRLWRQCLFVNELRFQVLHWKPDQRCVGRQDLPLNHECYQLLQECSIGSRQLLVIIRLESKPAFCVGTNLLVGELSLFITDEDLAVSGSVICCSISNQLSLACSFQAHEPKGSSVNSFGTREKTMVLQNHCFACAQGLSDAFAFFAVKHNTTEIVTDMSANHLTMDTDLLNSVRFIETQ